MRKEAILRKKSIISWQRLCPSSSRKGEIFPRDFPRLGRVRSGSRVAKRIRSAGLWSKSCVHRGEPRNGPEFPCALPPCYDAVRLLKILAIQFRYLGDAVLMTPALRALK